MAVIGVGGDVATKTDTSPPCGILAPNVGDVMYQRIQHRNSGTRFLVNDLVNQPFWTCK